MIDESDLFELYKTLRNPILEESISNGQRIMGYYCANLPEEILTAADIYPFRIRGTENKDFMKSDAILSRFNCTFVRSTLNLLLNQKYSFLDGLLIANTCDHVRRIYDILNLKSEELAIKQIPLFFLSLPHEFSLEAWKWLKEEILLLIESLESEYKINITESKIQEAIKVHDRNNELMQKISEFRSYEQPRLTGAQYFKISVSNNSLPKKIANQALEKLITKLQNSKTNNEKDVRARLMLVGSSSDNPDFIKVLEHYGGQIVTDSLCSGKRAYSNKKAVEITGLETEDPIDEIVSRVLLRTYCPRMMNGHKSRLQYIKDEIQEYDIDGVILQRIEFCDLHGVENGILQHELQEQLKIPILNIDREYFLGDTGRLKTRTEAFLEKITRGN